MEERLPPACELAARCAAQRRCKVLRERVLCSERQKPAVCCCAGMCARLVVCVMCASPCENLVPLFLPIAKTCHGSLQLGGWSVSQAWHCTRTSQLFRISKIRALTGIVRTSWRSRRAASWWCAVRALHLIHRKLCPDKELPTPYSQHLVVCVRACVFVCDRSGSLDVIWLAASPAPPLLAAAADVAPRKGRGGRIQHDSTKRQPLLPARATPTQGAAPAPPSPRPIAGQ